MLCYLSTNGHSFALPQPECLPHPATLTLRAEIPGILYSSLVPHPTCMASHSAIATSMTTAALQSRGTAAVPSTFIFVVFDPCLSIPALTAATQRNRQVEHTRTRVISKRLRAGTTLVVPKVVVVADAWVGLADPGSRLAPLWVPRLRTIPRDVSWVAAVEACERGAVCVVVVVLWTTLSFGLVALVRDVTGLATVVALYVWVGYWCLLSRHFGTIEMELMTVMLYVNVGSRHLGLKNEAQL